MTFEDYTKEKLKNIQDDLKELSHKLDTFFEEQAYMKSEIKSSKLNHRLTWVVLEIIMGAMIKITIY